MNLRNIEYILEIVQAGSLTIAAERLHISQPCLSRLIKQLESRYQVELFVHHSKPLRLTYAGEQFIDAITRIQYIERHLYHTMERIGNQSKGRIQLGIPLFRALAFLPEILATYKTRYPDVELHIHEAGSAILEKMLHEGKIDIAFASIGAFHDQIEYVTMFSEQIYVIAGKNTVLAQRIPSGSCIDITEAKNESFIYVKKGHGIRGIQDELFAAHKIAPAVFFETASIELAKRLAIVCDKVTLYPEIILTTLSGLQSGSYYTLQDAQNIRSFCVCHRKDCPQPRYLRDFIACAKDILGNIS